MGTSSQFSPPIYRGRSIARAMVLGGTVVASMMIGPSSAADELADVEAEATGGPPISLLDRRIALESNSRDNPFAITPHKPTYVLPVAYNSSPNNEPFESSRDEPFDKIEIKFQFSMKFSVWRNVFGDNGHFSLGYTQRSFWQAYDFDGSEPFRETNHEPEAMLTFLTDYRLLGFRGRVVTLGFVHQSNGQAGELSRSWDRLYVQGVFERGNLVVSATPWWRIPVKDEDDDNADIEAFLGYGELRGVYQLKAHTFGVLLRNNLRSENRGAVKFDWSFPLPNNRIRGYVEYFNGYGESLIDYNSSNNRLGVGFMLTDWL